MLPKINSYFQHPFPVTVHSFLYINVSNVSLFHAKAKAEKRGDNSQSNGHHAPPLVNGNTVPEANLVTEPQVEV